MDNNISFFMGTNSKNGFTSLFGGVAQEHGGCRVYTVKSGPGCGKSTLMRSLPHALGVGDKDVEYILCASDPDSLDGVILHRQGLAVLDGTAPHVLDPDFPGAGGGYIALPPFLNLPILESKLGTLNALAAQAKLHYAQSRRLISAAAKLEENVRAQLEPYVSEQKLRRRAQGIAARELGRKGVRGELRLRFIDGITPQGVLRLYQTINTMAKRVYVFADSYGFAGPMLEEIREHALKNGRVVYVCLCPINPERVLHIIIPELELAFVTSDCRAEYEGQSYRHIRIDAYVPPEAMRSVRGKIRLLQKISRSLLDDAVGEIRSAHSLHDEIEELYRPHIDTAALTGLPENLAKMLKNT